MRNKNMLIILICLILFLGVGCGTKEKVDPREREIIVLLNENQFDKAVLKAEEIYKGEDDKLNKILQWINKAREDEEKMDNQIKELYSSLSDNLEIQSGHTDKIKGDYYYINGCVKNVGNTDIKYFEVVCKFLDEGDQVLDSSYTNDGLTLSPNEIRKFEIMHKYDKKYDSYSLSIGKVK